MPTKTENASLGLLDKNAAEGITASPPATASQPDELSKDLVNVIKHMRDTSLRDGVQSWDGNQWKIDDIVEVAKETNKLALAVNNIEAGAYAPTELWGGGQVNQPAKFLKEDPFINLEKIHEAAPDLDIQVLYRGRQGYGFKPISEDVQRDALEASIERGVKVVRIFDMMNDPENVRTGAEILKAHNEKHPENKVTIEGAVSYISEPEGGKRAWELSDYADYAVKLASMGCHEIAVKNFCGVADKEMPELISTMRDKLNEAGFESVPVNIHSHGEKVDLYASLINDKEKGAQKVDVAIGELSDGPSHTNMRSLIHKLLDNKYDAAHIDQHPIMQQLAQVETAIHTVVHRTNEKGESFDSKRGPLKNLNRDDIEKYRVAGGAFSDVWARASAMVDTEVQAQKAREATTEVPTDTSWAKRGAPSINVEAANRSVIDTKKKVTFYKMLDLAPEAWEKAGRFNTVTPGAKILTDQISVIAAKKLSNPNAAILMTDYTPEYLDVATGRYGENKGMEKGIGDKKFENAALMFRALQVINKAVEAGDISNTDMPYIKGNRPITTLLGSDKRIFNLKDANLENILGETDIDVFANAVKNALPKNIAAKVIKELHAGRSETPRQTTQEMSEEIFNRLGTHPKDFETNPSISSKTLPVLACLTHDTQKGQPNDTVLENLLSHHKALQPTAATKAAGDTDAGINQSKIAI
jgi:pyruvate/oxaloacetate carboxyltransferase